MAKLPFSRGEGECGVTPSPLRGEGGGEGQRPSNLFCNPFQRHPPYLLQHRVRIAEHVVVPESQHPIPLAFQPGGAACVFGLPFGMLAAVGFDDEAGFVAQKIGDEGADGVLASGAS